VVSLLGITWIIPPQLNPKARRDLYSIPPVHTRRNSPPRHVLTLRAATCTLRVVLRPRQCNPGGVERARDPEPAAVQYVGVDHRRADILMSKEFLHGANVVARLKKVSGKGVTKGVARHAATHGDVLGGDGDRPLHHAGINVVAAHDARVALDVLPRRREYPLPPEVARGGGEFASQRVREHDGTVPAPQVTLVHTLHSPDLRLKRGDERVGKWGAPVATSLAGAHNQLAPLKVEILDAQCATLGDS